ncbi:putative ATP-grasp superfamily ATP-dependent carboligase [Kribbella sp. VKM Ac-2527]|uniref:Putative ATP-grasp superfamily ATP-dependent carboligase n=1 Tax=Kribbella caucasensis TaxID=2512215 RepID=A0A4R6KFG7_9ACTN|nr:ATP-grasp domain-containing protein [Kribbella sp. VKM Ac-2527]TDO48560.1 putative ATP-grasp superfamily ATP-dependent carboligase [Kribbella sp. VKM Ac-2527]
MNPSAVVVGGDYQGLGIVRSLGRRGVRVVVLDDEPSISRVSRYTSAFERVPELRDAEETKRILIDTCTRLGLQGSVLYPTREETVATIAAHRTELAEYFRLPTPAWESVQPAWDKRETYQRAERLGIPIPRCWFPTSAADLDQIDLSSPVILKPAIKENFFYTTRAKAWRVDTRAELAAAYQKALGIVGAAEVIVQELIPGGGEHQVAYCAFFKDGDAVAEMTVRRRRQHPSDFGRASTYVETIDLPELGKHALTFLRDIGYYGLVELEFKEDRRDGSYKLLDVNARTWGYHSLGQAAGVDFPYLVYRDQIGQPVSSAQARHGVRWIRLATDLPNAALDIRAGRARLGAYLKTLRGVDTEAVFSLRDPLPALYELALLPYLAVKRGL